MKTLSNGILNDILFFKGADDFNVSDKIGFKQLGSTLTRYVDVVNTDIDCFTARLWFNLQVNNLQNATYLLFVEDANGEVIATTTVVVDKHNDTDHRAFIVFDDNQTPPPVIDCGTSVGGLSGLLYTDGNLWLDNCATFRN